MYKAASYSDRDGLGTITGIELLHNVLNMSLYRFLRDEKARCDVAVSTSSGELLQDLNLSPAQRFLTEMLYELNRNLVRDLLLPGMHLADHIYELPSGHAFEHVALRSRLQRQLNLGIPFKRRKHDHARICELCANGEQCIDTPHIRHPQIHKCHVG